MRHLCVALLLALPLHLLFACGSSHEDTDAGEPPIVFDASLPGDGGGGPASAVGRSCSADADCESADLFCQTDPTLFPEGYCTGLCGTDADCPEGSTCLAVSDTAALCFLACDLAAERGACHEGQGCSTILGPPVCLDGCSGDSDCASIPGTSCAPSGGFLGAGSCLADDLGGACADDSQCTGDAFCVGESSGYPGGTCAAYGCDSLSGAGCPAGAECVQVNDFQSYCFDACGADADCREGYACRDSSGAPAPGAGSTYCQPACVEDSVCSGGRSCHLGGGVCIDSTQLGAACTFRGGCDGGACISERTDGFPGNYCVFFGCELGVEGACPSDGVCAAGSGGPESNYCLDGCAGDEGCRDGYACLPTVEGDPTSPLACLPACTDDSVCNTSRGRVCDVATGRCVMGP